MEQDCILTLKEGENAVEYRIDRILLMDGKCYFTILNQETFDFMFGEFSGEISEDTEQIRQQIYRDFQTGCSHISYPDGYIVDDLYAMMDPFMMDPFMMDSF